MNLPTKLLCIPRDAKLAQRIRQEPGASAGLTHENCKNFSLISGLVCDAIKISLSRRQIEGHNVVQVKEVRGTVEILIEPTPQQRLKELNDAVEAAQTELERAEEKRNHLLHQYLELKATIA